MVIIGRNEGTRLDRCLNSAKSQSFPGHELEVLYVDSGSTDGSPERAAENGARVLTLSDERPTAAKGRNRGFREAKGEFLFFVDGDTVIHPEFLNKAVAYLDKHPHVAAVSGTRCEMFPEKSLYIRVLDLDWTTPPGESPYCGGDAVIRARVLEEVQPYREDLIAGEEPELCSRIRSAGHKIHRLDLPMTDHDLDIHKFSGYWMRNLRTGHAYAEVARLTAGETFGRESTKNLLQMAIYLLVPLLLIAVFRGFGVLILLAGGSLVLARTLWRARWRKASPGTLFFYALHGHFCQIPIFLGQIKYFLGRRRQKPARLIEYK